MIPLATMQGLAEMAQARNGRYNGHSVYTRGEVGLMQAQDGLVASQGSGTADIISAVGGSVADIVRAFQGTPTPTMIRTLRTAQPTTSIIPSWLWIALIGVGAFLILKA